MIQNSALNVAKSNAVNYYLLDVGTVQTLNKRQSLPRGAYSSDVWPQLQRYLVMNTSVRVCVCTHVCDIRYIHMLAGNKHLFHLKINVLYLLLKCVSCST